MLRTGRDEPQVPDGPANWALPEAIRANARATVVQGVGRNAMPTERPQEVAPLITNLAIAHGTPLLRLQPEYVRDPFGVFIPFQVGPLQASDPCDRERAGIAVFVRDAAQISSGAFVR